MNESVYKYIDNQHLKTAFEFCEGYKNFISISKTEREVIFNTIKIAEDNGFKNIIDLIKEKRKLKSGDKVYSLNMDKSLILCIIGKEPLSNGLNILGAHIDSPRIDLKVNTIYEDSGLCLLDTHYYGGIKKYHWVAMPLALHGVVFKKSGEKILINIGEKDDDPVFVISDLLPHLNKSESKTPQEISGEDLNVLFGSLPDSKAEKNKVKSNILKLLKDHYNIESNDLFSAELQIVPAGKAKDCGLDRSLIAGYGQDDRVCSYACIQAILNVEKPTKTAITLLVDKEEIGSVGTTSMQSFFFENTLVELISLIGTFNELDFRHCLVNSNMLSCDVTAGFDPNYKFPFDEKNDAYLGNGVSFNKYTGSKGKSGANDANPEYIAKLRNVLEEAKINFQATEMGKVDSGGGGTISHIMARYGMNVIDAGIPLLNMHAPWEVSSKIDIYEMYRCYLTFFDKM